MFNWTIKLLKKNSHYIILKSSFKQSYLPLHGDKSYQINLIVQEQINMEDLFVIGFANADQLSGENQFLSAVNLSLDKLNYIQASSSNNDYEEELKGNSQVNSSQNLRKKNIARNVNSKQMFNKNSLLVHGPSGCGKSLQAQKLFNYIWKKQDQFQILHELYDVYYNFVIIPILINLNTLDDPYNNIVEQALKDPQQYNFSDEEVQKFKKDVQNGAYQVVFIIDGLSEMGENLNKKNFFQMHKLDEWRQQNEIPKDQEQNKQNQQSLYQGQQALQQLQQNINQNDEQENIMNHNFPKIIYFVRTQSLVGGDYQKNYFIPTHQNFNQNIKNFKELKVQKLDEHDINQYIQTYLLFQVKQKIANLYRSLVKNPKNIFKIIKEFNSFWKNLQIKIKKDIQYQEFQRNPDRPSNNKLLSDQSIKYIIEQVITNIQSSKLLTDIHPQDRFILRLKKDLQEIISFENIENKLNLISGIRQKIQTYHFLEMCLQNLDQISLNFVKKQTNMSPESMKMNFFLTIQDKVLQNLQQYRAIVDYYQDSVIQQISPQKWERIMEFRQTMLPFQEQTLIRKITSEQISILWNLVLEQFKKISQNNQQEFSEQQLIKCLEIVISQGKFSRESQQKQQDIDVYELLKNYLNNQIEQLRFLFKIKDQESDLYSTKNSKYISSKSNIDSKKHIGSDLSNKLNSDGSFIRDLKPTESNLLIKYMNYKIKFAFKMIANDTFQSFTFKKYNIIEAYLNQQRENNIQKIPNLSAQQQSELRQKSKAYSIQLAQQFCKLGVTRVKITDQKQTQKLGTWILPNGEFQPFFPEKLTQQDKYIREICPFKIVNNHFSFSHKVFQDFFVSENLYEKLSQIKILNFICSIIELYELEPIQGQNKKEFIQKLDKIIQDFHRDHKKEVQDFYSKYEEDININKVLDEIGNIQNIFSKIDIKVEPLNMDIFNFIGEKSFQDVQFEKLLLNIVKLSKFFSDNELQKAAAQSITILNQINFPLSAQNFNSVNIQGASLQGAQLSLTNFSKSNLNNVCLNDAFVDLANFKMSNVQKEHIQSLSQNSMNNSFQQQQKIQNMVISNQQKNNQDKNGYQDNLQDIYFHKADVNIEIGENENADQVLVTPDSQYLIITYPGLGLLKIHDMTVISQFISLPGQLAISRVDCTNDSKFLAFDFAPFKISRNQNIKIYNINDLVVEGRQSKYLELECKQGKVNTFKFTINQKFLIIAFENKIVQVWNFEAIQKDYDNLDQFIPLKISQQNRLVQSINNFRGEIKTLDVYPFDKYFVTGGGYQESELKIWELPLENQIQQQNMISSKKQNKFKFELKGHRSTVTAVQFSKNGNLLVSASFDQTVRIWNVIDIFNSKSQEFQIHQTLSGVHKEAILSISLAFDDKFILSGGCDKGIIAQYRFFDLYRQKNSEQETNVYNKIQTLSNGQVNCITYSQDNNFVVVSFDDKTVQVFKNYSYKNESELILQTVIKSQYKNSTSSNFTQLEGSVQLEGNFKY
ncbi:WD40-repeat-containing domain [Pseudocohnilembus persalinus]|uniref:WD40-repeat-containing domain n=1 Tax=Pseudocohnilembus persalinus TaxID=266149 RepID=A0A0V0QV46_PSEPJ|nr:WD40-repeat-containing domain [Pseudocohnilembus persalinus]|eukprot:KRX06236.1 WD40-repeat-containing domain [Pseudocohnilembus persalinus]